MTNFADLRQMIADVLSDGHTEAEGAEEVAADAILDALRQLGDIAITWDDEKVRGLAVWGCEPVNGRMLYRLVERSEGAET